VSTRAVFLDRDGVLNRAIVRAGKPYPPASPEELEILPGVPQALKRLKGLGYLLIVVTNQPDVARGNLRERDVESIHLCMAAMLPIDDFRTCFHDTGDGCACRKPRPGMLLDAAARWDVDLASSYMIGDRWRDVDAGNAAGCKVFFVDHGYDEARPREPYRRVGSLPEAVEQISLDKRNEA
jgi:D-glycero-D-manno-heptose 1,7-bisphosphate phosphatase